eukprot:SM000107S14035  [mRNA]  locus=s107:76899:78771:+ [translate_table: standard]
MPASADPLLDAPTKAAGLPLQPALPPGSSSSGGSLVFVSAPCLLPSSPSVQNKPQLVCELPSMMSLLPTGPLASLRHAPNTNTRSKVCFYDKSRFDTCELLREHLVKCNLPEVPIIGITKNRKRIDLDKYAMSGYSAVLEKPINECRAGKRLGNYLKTYKPPSRKDELIGARRHCRGQDSVKISLQGISIARRAGKWLRNYLIIYTLSPERRAQPKRGDNVKDRRPFIGFMALV